MILMLLLALAVLAALGWYFGLRILSALAFFGLRMNPLLFWLLLAGGMVAILLTRSALICVPLYGILLFALGDLAGLVLKNAPAAQAMFTKIWLGGLMPIILALLVTIFAVWNAHNPALTRYSVTVDKALGGLDNLRIVMVADVHLGTAVHEKDLPRLIEHINGQSPDVIALCGDIFEEGTPQALREAAIAAFGELRSTYGTYYITGNHDSRVSDDEAARFAASQVTVLDGQCLLIDDRFYLAGRPDGGHSGWDARMSAADLLSGIDGAKPVIVLDHRPGAFRENAAAGADLQLSGHTHATQLWPFSPLGKLVNGINYGTYEQPGFSAIVTSGYGVWGFATRTSQRCEYVRVDVTPAR